MYQTKMITAKCKSENHRIHKQWQQHTINLLVAPLEIAYTKLVSEKLKS